MSKKELDFTNDEYWGKGGTYVVDPATGKRSPAPVVEEAAAPDSAAESDAAKTLKETRRAR